MVASSRIASSALSDARVEVVTVESLEQPVLLHEILEAAAHLDERHVHTRGVQLLVELLEHPRSSDVDVGDGLALHDDPARVPLADKVADLTSERARVREEQRRLPAVDDDSRMLSRRRDSFEIVPALEPFDLAEHRAVRPPVAAEEQQHGEGDGDHDALQDTEQDHPDRRRERQQRPRSDGRAQ